MKPTYEKLEFHLKNTQEALNKSLEALAKTQKLLKLALDRISELEERINKKSKNSSKPPSTDRKPNSDGQSSKERKSRHGVNRAPIPSEKVDQFVDCNLTNCPDCGSDQINKDGSLECLQQIDLPEVKALITQFNRFRYKCGCCGNRSMADLPSGIPNSAFGTRLMALIATLTGAFHLSKRDAIRLVKDLYGIDICEGSIINVEERVANAIEEVYDRIHRVVTGSVLCKHFDETSWRNQGRNGYVWVAGTSQAVCFKIDSYRSREVFHKFVGKSSSSPVVTDRYAVYNNFSNDHQYCLAHLIRDFRKYGERKGIDGEIGRNIEEELRAICKNHRQYREGARSLKSRDHRLRFSRKRLENHLIDGLASGSDDLANFCENILDRFDKLWTFAKFPNVEPTNNLAERDLRKIVLWRKKSYGTRSNRGQRFVERISTVCGTLRRTGQNIFEFLKKVTLSFYTGTEVPFICPALGF
jgi:transposase